MTVSGCCTIINLHLLVHANVTEVVVYPDRNIVVPDYLAIIYKQV